MKRTAWTIGLFACVVLALWGAALYRLDPSERAELAPSAAAVPRAPSPTQSAPIARVPEEREAHEAHAPEEAKSAAPELQAWRAAWSTEREDPSWTRQMTRELTQMAESLAYGEVVLSGLSCRQTVCRMQLQFADALDARLFIEAAHDPKLRQAYASVEPADGVGVAKSEHTYELLIKRPSADYAPEPGSPGGIRPAGGSLRVLPAKPAQ